jgi:hypothetical protein
MSRTRLDLSHFSFFVWPMILILLSHFLFHYVSVVLLLSKRIISENFIPIKLSLLHLQQGFTMLMRIIQRCSAGWDKSQKEIQVICERLSCLIRLGAEVNLLSKVFLICSVTIVCLHVCLFCDVLTEMKLHNLNPF